MSTNYRVTKIIEFDAGHRVPWHTSVCKNVHGHRYRLEITVEGYVYQTPGSSQAGMILDFSDIKQAAMERIHANFDHVLILMEDDPLLPRLGLPMEEIEMPPPLKKRIRIHDFGWVQLVPGVPTAENLAKWCFELLSVLNELDHTVVSVRLWETPNSMAEVYNVVKAIGI